MLNSSLSTPVCTLHGVCTDWAFLCSFSLLRLGFPSKPLFRHGIGSVLVVLVDVNRLPGVADPLVADGPGRVVVVVDDVLGQEALLLLVLVLHAEASCQCGCFKGGVWGGVRT